MARQAAVQPSLQQQEEVSNTVNQQSPAVTQTSAASRKRERVSMSVPKQKLSIHMEIPGYHLYWMNDEGARLMDAGNSGYEFVTAEEVYVNPTSPKERVSKPVGKKENGEGMIAYLMKIRQEWYEEDQLTIQDSIDRVDSAIERGTWEESSGASQGRYVPRGHKNKIR